MTRKTNCTCKRRPSRDSYQTLNYANLIPKNLLHSFVLLHPTFVNAFRQNIEIDQLDHDQTITTPEEVASNAIAAARALLAGILGQEMQKIGFIAEDLPEEQVIEARQRTRLATDLLTQRRPPKYSNPLGQQMFTFDQVIIDQEMKLLQHYRHLQGTLTKIAK
ncbi:MAG: hypothetical protein EZS28_017476 [Streblomastix strix]|uniref:Uncharacterized protein n=1 Tax=Streblomastix strix TaxID=222440 RepID=A0A5J4VWS1_9EUKA|nr:MAG: hypothetical protein EZS28_017476 [Streblomastix strix]